MQTRVRALVAIVFALTALGAISERVRQQSVTDTEIRIGNLMPYSGNLEVFGAIGKAEAAYFEMINERGGIGGRKGGFISYDDKSNPVAPRPYAPSYRGRQRLVDVWLFRNSGQLCRSQI